jgi:hypothetical protein
MTQHREFVCCHEGCMALICLTPEQEQKFRDTHDSFRCPMGHQQGFYGDTPDEKEIKVLRQRISVRDGHIRYQFSRIQGLERELRSARAKLGIARRRLRA